MQRLGCDTRLRLSTTTIFSIQVKAATAIVPIGCESVSYDSAPLLKAPNLAIARCPLHHLEELC